MVCLGLFKSNMYTNTSMSTTECLPFPLVTPCPQSNSHEKEYAFEMAMSNLRYGDGVTREVGWDVLNLGIKNLVVFTDKNVSVLVTHMQLEQRT